MLPILPSVGGSATGKGDEVHPDRRDLVPCYSQAAKRDRAGRRNSPPVKTAIAGGDAILGRIVMAVGNKAGEKALTDNRSAIAIDVYSITEGGQVRPDYDERPVADHMAGSEVKIAIDVGNRLWPLHGRAWNLNRMVISNINVFPPQ